MGSAMRYPIFQLMFIILTSPYGQAHNSFLWRIDLKPPSYFFGTIHVPYTRVWNYIAQNSKDAFRDSDLVYFELDLTDPGTLSALSTCQLLPQGQHLSQVIPTDIYVRLRLHLEYIHKQIPSWITPYQEQRGIDPEYLFSAITSNWERKQPIWITLMINSLNQKDISSRGFPVLDLYLSKLAGKQKKKIKAIERVKEQCGPLNRLNASQVVFALNQTLKRQEELRYFQRASAHQSTDDLIESYKSGNLNKVIYSRDSILLPSLAPEDDNSLLHLSPSEFSMAQTIDSFFRQYMIDQRNRRMAARVIDLLVNRPGKSYFFAFGAGHFIGNNSILDLVQSAGFKIDHIQPGESLYDSKTVYRTYSSSSKATVQGTFNDLSENQKTRALLQFLQYQQQQEQTEETKKFQKLIGQQSSSESYVDNDKSLSIWYGIDTINNYSKSPTSSPSITLTNIFSSGVITENSKQRREKEEEVRKETTPPKETIKNPKTLKWIPWLIYYASFSGCSAVQMADSIGEKKLGWFFGITSPKYFYEIQEFKRNKQEQEEKEVKANAQNWNRPLDQSVITLDPKKLPSKDLTDSIPNTKEGDEDLNV
ncbi:Metalloprotease TIKI2,Metalloprotease TIKI homolog,Metalloprotease TIKI1 [Lepeophtheirus salmonis]|uniref:Metalloprotease TIKI homolog n=1 Tax=Lepeophtheirus salmonis TaxID=72036 RepID=A0A7R8H2E1_LEPSM|nr:Metalloprotease TIKI2,Metalloprotease TIKI homolog,Metalloprotease TIKI1 [Lepeophtheirus salmonis]CAF2823164.1 Metalloprotease TIKI2,Metalloprotease TIKI homolog,Metalloprotease TIKI1 [Lepeophtheirus salmonis]